MEILGAIKTYDWGKLGSSSTVAELAHLNDPSFVPQEDVPYSELWMGDHTSGFSRIKTTLENLGDFIQKDKDGNAGGFSNLPYLFKVLSIRKALSIQVHPNKKEAERLHAEFPDIYKDPNHKPELAIALTEFHAMCGFRPYAEILGLLSGEKRMIFNHFHVA
jgi:mannose-6-phosphate isomerase